MMPALFVSMFVLSFVSSSMAVLPPAISPNGATQSAVIQNTPVVRFVAPRPGEKKVSFKIALPSPLNSSSGTSDNGRLAQNDNLPESASALPLLTIIGAGVLIGGLFSARRTRRQ